MKLKNVYTGNQHLDMFSLVNMLSLTKSRSEALAGNGRMYDPLLGRMLSPDNYVQAPNSSQSFNRYSYVMNNPLVYVDPDGEYIGLLALGFAFSMNFVENAMRGEYDALGTAWTFANDYVNDLASFGQFTIYSDDDIAITAGIDLLSAGVSVNAYYQEGDFLFHGKAGVGYSSGKPSAFINGDITYYDGDFSITVGGGIGTNYKAFGGSVTYDGYGIGYHQTYYGNADGPGGVPNSQIVAGYSFYFNDVTFTIENDIFARKGQDRWRTSSWELRVGEFGIGSYIYTNDPGNTDESGVYDGKSPTWRENQREGYSVWENGIVYEAPFYISYYKGGSVSRLGYSHWRIQDIQQNGIHQSRIITRGNQNYYLKYDKMNIDLPGYLNIYGFSGFYNPYTLFYR
ncbi:MAG: hypothetical protein B6D61_03275 [Bacteroidetes bacterium 4484_249]|nr:MAG: hypothetical protein B6D61_03275 [Bacteroidetes bacterium 4484_249]